MLEGYGTIIVACGVILMGVGVTVGLCFGKLSVEQYSAALLAVMTFGGGLAALTIRRAIRNKNGGG